MPSSGMALAAEPALTRPQTRLRLDRGSTRRDSAAGSSVMILPRAKTRSAVRCGRAVCPPGPVTRTVILSQAAVIGPTLSPDLADVQPRVAVQGEDPVNRGDAAGRQHVQRAAWHLLGRLEDQPDPAGQRPGRRRPGQEQAGAEQHRGVHVMPAGVAGVAAPSTGRERSSRR